MEDEYDEFAKLNAYTVDDVSAAGKPVVERRFFDVAPGQRISGIAWGNEEPEIVFFHGRGQNAHTWDSVALALNVPLLALDLPGHGHSDWRADHDYGPRQNADAIAPVIARAAPQAELIVGMSLGGLTNIRLSARYPEVVQRAVIIDTTPASRDGRPELSKEQRGAVALLEAPAIYDSFEDILRTAADAIPGRPIESLRTGVRHNSRQLDDGRWIWRYDRERPEGGGSSLDRESLWADLERITAPIMLVRAGQSGRVLDEDVDKFLRLQPTAQIEVVEESGHSVQSDQPRELATLIRDFLASTR